MASPQPPPCPKTAAARSHRSLCGVVIVIALCAAGCAELERATRQQPPQPANAGGGGIRDQREAEMNRRWQDQTLTELVATLGQPMLTMNIPGGGTPPGFVVVYGEHGSSGCIDAFAVNSGREPRVRVYYCR